MNLFFETSGQAQIFLATVPIGFLLALLIDVDRGLGALRPVWDVLCMLACGAMMLMVLLMMRDGGLRVYHALALLTGSLLYLVGVRRAISAVRRRLGKKQKKWLFQRRKRNENVE